LTLEDHDPLRFPVELLRASRSLRHLTDLVRLHLERQAIRRRWRAWPYGRSALVYWSFAKGCCSTATASIAGGK